MSAREKVVQNAEKLIGRGKIEAGIREYLKLLDEAPNDISILNRVGDLYARVNRIGEAVDLFAQIARRYTQDGFFVKAIAICKKIIKLDPTRLEFYEMLADLYHRQGLIKEARTQYQVLADCYQRDGNATSAIAIYRKMVELEPENPTHRAKLAELYQSQKLTEKALEEYKAIAELMLQHGHLEQAAQVYERALDVSAEDIGFITDAVLKLKQAGQIAAATHLLALATERNPKAERVGRLAGLGGGLDQTGTFVRSGADQTGSFVRPASTPQIAAPAPERPPEAVAAPPPEDPLAGLPADAFEIDLDDEPSGVLVQPPPDMAADRARPGAAFARPGDRAAPAPAPPAPAPPPVAPRLEAPEPAEELEFEIDLDLDLDLGGDFGGLEGDSTLLVGPFGEPSSPSLASAAPAAAPDEPGLLDHDLLERTAAEVHPSRSLHLEDLLTEAEVLAKYGIEDKALERLRELLERDPVNLAGLRLAILLYLDTARHEEAAALASRMARLADRSLWPEVRERLESAGFKVDGAAVTLPGAGVAPVDLSGFDEMEIPGASPAAAESVRPQFTPPPRPEELAPPQLTPIPVEPEFDLEADLLSLPDLDDLPAAPAPETPAPPTVEQDFKLLSVPEVAELGFEMAEQSGVFTLGPLEPEEALTLEPEAEPEPPPAPPPAPAAKPAGKRKVEDVDQFLQQIKKGVFPAGRPKPAAPSTAAPVASAPPPQSAPTPPPVSLDLPEVLAALPGPEPSAPTPSAPPPAAPSGGIDPLRALGASLRAEIDDEDLSDLTFPTPGSWSPPPASVSPPAVKAAGGLDDTGMSWLDEAPATGGDRLFDDEKDFFDLGAELEQELSAEETMLGGNFFLGAEQSLEEIVEGFKKGVADNLSAEDYDTHFNLGIAYREMGLLDEAIGEFQLSAKAPELLVSCASMLGMCFLEKGLPELAIKWYKRGLEAPALKEEDQLGLLYDLGNAELAASDRDRAYRTFVELYGIDSNYRDIVAILAELQPERAW